MTFEPAVPLFGGKGSLRWLGTNCLIIGIGEQKLIVDPHFTRPGKLALWRKISPDPAIIRRELQRLDLPHLDAVLLTHTHYDHALDAAETACQSGAQLWGSESCRHIGSGAGLSPHRIVEVQPNKVYPAGGFKITFCLGQHLEFPGHLDSIVRLDGAISDCVQPPQRFWKYRSGPTYHILLEAFSHRLLIAGSAGLVGNDQTIPAADCTVLGIGGLGLKSFAYRERWFRQIVLGSGAHEVYLSHWDDFTRPLRPFPAMLPGTRIAIKHILELAHPNPAIKVMQLFPS